MRLRWLIPHRFTTAFSTTLSAIVKTSVKAPFVTACLLLSVFATGSLSAQKPGNAPNPPAPPSDRPTQEMDNAIFNYTRLEIDAARPGGSTESSVAGEGWVGTDFNRIWWKASGRREGGILSDAEAQVMYGRYIRPYTDFQVGVRRTFRPGGENYAVVALQALVPYMFEAAGELFVSDRGRLSGRAEAGYELLWTNRLISRPGVSVDLFASPDPALGQPAGVGDVEVRLPTRYEISRQFAPYVEVRHNRRTGSSEALAQNGGGGSGWSLRGGLRLVF